MKYKITKKDKNQVVINIDITSEEWNAEVELAYNQNKGKYNVEGFRKGKAPRKVIEKMYGAGIFFEDALNNAFSTYYTEILNKEKSLEPVDAPSLDVKNIDEKGVTLEAIVTVKPEVKLGAYTGLNISVKPKKVTDKEVEEELKMVQQQNARLVEVKEGEQAKLGNIVNINFAGFVDGVQFPGGTSEGYDLELGSKSFIDTFEDQIVGMKNGEKKDVLVTFPADYHEETLKGKPAKFEVTVNAIKEKILPEIDDELASNVSNFETLEEYKNDIKKHLEHHAEENAKIEAENKILDKIVDNMEVEVPDCMVEHELNHMMQDLEYRLMYQGLNLQAYANYLNTTVEKIREDRKKDALKSVKIRLALQEIMNKEKIDVTEDDFNAKIKEMADRTNKSVKDFKATLKEERINYIKNDILMNKLINFLLESNK